MDAQYDIQWIQHHGAVMKPENTLIIEDDNQSSSSLQDDEYFEGSVADIDQIAAENLIFMARDGQMMTEIIATDGGTTTVADTEEEGIGDVMQHDDEEFVYDTETTPQMVTEEVITDDWVQRQGAERVEIPADQIIGSGSQVVLDIEVPLPTVQDEYTALRPYPCDFCSRRFRKKASLMNHMVAHQNDRPNLCKLCGSRFFRRSDLINHLHSHAEATELEQQRRMEVDLSGCVGQIDNERLHYQIQAEHYYEYDGYDEEQISRSEVKHASKLTNGNSNSSSSSTAMRIGRISRLKPKRDAFSIDVVASQSNEVHNHELLPTYTTAIKQLKQQPQEQEYEREQKLRYPIIDTNKPFVCQQCGLAFAREKALSAHVKNHRNEAPYECDQCNEMFWEKEALQDHQKSHQFEASNSEYDPDEGEDETQSESEVEQQQQLYGEFFCGQCGVSFHRQDLLKRHAKAHVLDAAASTTNDVGDLLDKSGRHCCNTCGETFEEALDLLAHAEIHARYPPFKCVLCGESFFEEATIKRHLLSQHGEAMTINSCILCGKECRDRKALIKHAWDHSREKCHSCSKCGKNFHNKARLKRHMASHRDKSVTCNVCFEEFPDGRSLSNHRHSHSTTSAGKLFPCNECGKTFGSRSSQQIHVRIHTGEKPYGCRYCWKAFADGGTLRKHERIHTGEKPYACSVCPRAFNQRVVLREHIRSHHSGLDPKRGTYFCTVCEDSMSSSNELIQHLIQHSDLNTAKQRKPVIGPRKYKRRRKLKPHEIERLRNDSKREEEETADSDIDITDIDMDNVDDLLAITEESTSTTTNSRRSKSRAPKNGTIKPINNHVNKRNKSTAIVDEHINVDELSPTTSRSRYHSTNSNSEKLWPSKLGGTTIPSSNDESLLLSFENTLQSIDTLVVGSERIKYNNASNNEHNAQRTQPLAFKRTGEAHRQATERAALNSRTRRKQQTATKAPARPRMIHTEKSRPQANGNNINDNSRHRRSTTTITTTATTTTARSTIRHEPATALTSSLDLLPTKTLTIVDDYEIISPATQPPYQISSSPIHIKQEDSEHQHHYRQLQLQQLQQHQQQLLQDSNNEQRRRRRYLTSQSSQTSRSSDLYDAQLLLDAATLRKDCFEKFNPSIVNDLEEILRSPLKTHKVGERMRLTSECSATQYLGGDQSEEEAAPLIKLEPTSPDFQALFSCANASGGSSDTNKTPERPRSSRNRQVMPNRRYLEFETTTTTPTKQTPPAKQTRRSAAAATTNTKSSIRKMNSKDHGNGVGSSINATTAHHNSSISISTTTTPTAYHRNSISNVNSVGSVSAADMGNAYDAMSTIDAAAAAVHAAEAAAANSAAGGKRNKCYFECEMCSLVFTDRAQLLDHVPIHI